MLVVGFRGTTLDQAPGIAAALAAGELGGVCLFDRDGLTKTAGRNITSPDQLEALTAALQQQAAQGSLDGVLLVSVDQEGGKVARLGPQDGYPATPSEATLGAANDLARTTEVATSTAAMLKGAGINLNLAPVVDLNLNPSNPAIGALGRSFSANPDVVVAQATAVIDAHHGADVRCAIKHFPGEGSATGNTDEGIVDVTATWTTLELEPFKRLIAGNVPDVVMVGHIKNDQLDPDRPAALSRPTVTDLLRGQLGWLGPVISDDLQAGAITQAFGADEAVALAIEAGIDLLLFANQQVYDPDIVEHTIATIEGLIDAGRIPESRIDEAVARIREVTSTVE
jgi:beta-N-acetylhexosaminidase